MIAALALFAAGQLNPVSEWVDPGARSISVQAVVKLPHLSPREEAEATLLASTMADEVEGYSRTEMRDLAGSVGDSLRITLMPDHLRISISLPPNQLQPGLAYIDQLLRRSRLSEDSLNKALATLPYRSQPLWTTALQPYKLDWSHIRREDVVDLYLRLFRPETVWVAAGGPIKSGEADGYWQSLNADWSPGRLRSRPLEPLTRVDGVAGAESIVELSGPQMPGSDVALPTKLLALIALGSGKGSAMFDRLREAHGWSYRQEAVLWPTESGFVPRLIMATGDKTPLPDLAKEMKKELSDAVAAWTEDDLNRAKGMAEGILLRGVPMSPLYFGSTWPVTESLDDRTFLAAYWRMKTGHDWSPQKLLGQMALVSLDDLKEAGKGMLEFAIPLTLSARG